MPPTLRPTDATTDTKQTLLGFVEQHAGRRPDGIALQFGDRQWSWAQWSARIGRAAGALRAEYAPVNLDLVLGHAGYRSAHSARRRW